MIATREPSDESLECKVAIWVRLPEFELRWPDGRLVLLCAVIVEAASRAIARYLKTEDEMARPRGDWFIVLIIGATSTKKLANADAIENYAKTPARCHWQANQLRVDSDRVCTVPRVPPCAHFPGYLRALPIHEAVR